MTTAGDEWRYEADEDWLAGRRSAFFRRRRSRFFRALSDAELGPFGGAPRNPRLKVDGQRYSHVRYAFREFSYTTIQVELRTCRKCGRRLLEEHRLVLSREDGVTMVLGRLSMCRRCEKEAWLFTSHMPSAVGGRRRDVKAVL